MPDSTVAVKRALLRRKILGVKIRHARNRSGLSAEEVGQAFGLSPEAITETEYGKRDVTLPQLEVMALLFNVPVIYFWSDEPVEEPNLDFPSLEAMALRRRVIGALLRQARAMAGRSQEELANLLGVPYSRISNYESGKEEIPLQHLETLTEYLNVSLSYFIDEGISPSKSGGNTATLEEITQFSQLPNDVREFLSNPANLLYINIAMKLSELSADTLRALAEGLLEVTY